MRILPDVQWPSGREQGLLVLKDNKYHLHHRFGFEFQRLEDQLGELHAVFMMVGPSTPVMLSWRRHSPEPGTVVYIDDDDAREAAAAFIDEPGLREDDVTRVSPRVLWSSRT